MDEFVQIIGSIASILGVPLAIYLFLKGREEKYEKIRQAIIKVISFQIGENRNLNLFEVEKVVSSQLRNNKISGGKIEVKDILEDLVCETMSSPLLNADRKNEIINNIKEIYPVEENYIQAAPILPSLSSAFAVSTLIASVFPLAISIVVGQEKWSSELDWLISFNFVQGYKGNLFVSIILAFFGLLLALVANKILKKIDKLRSAA